MASNRPSRGHDLPRDAGFTLLETLIALAILGAAMAAGYAGLRDGSLWLDRSWHEETALDLAEGLLERAGQDIPLRPGETKGEASGGLTWHLTIGPPVSGAAGSAFAGYQVDVVVNWTDWPFAREVHLHSLRLGPRLPPA